MKSRFINKKTGAEAKVIAIYLDSDGVMQVDSYDTVEDLMDDYAAYEEYVPPKELLIKDEKIRKAELKVGDIIGTIRYGGEYKPIYYFDELCGEEE